MRSLFLASCLLICGAGVPAFAADQDFTLANKTGYQIDEVYVGPVSSESWGNDIMGRGSLMDGASVDITFKAPGSECQWDMKVKYNDGDTAEWKNLNLCSISKISLFWDKKAGVSRAVSE
jgi:hypothetical protein